MAAGSPAQQVLDPEIKAFLERRLYVIKQGQKPLNASPMPVTKVVDFHIDGPSGDIPVRLYYPEGDVVAMAEPVPLLVYLHGGCWFLNPQFTSHDRFCRRLATGAVCVVLAVDYRLAPACKFPAGLEDSFTAACYAVQHAARLGCNPEKVAIAGDSAGGNLAAAVCLLAKERGTLHLCAQVLLYPLTDYYLPTKQSLIDYNIGLFGVGFSASCYKFGWDILGADKPPHGAPGQPSTLAAILRHPDLSDLAPAYIVVGGCDIVRDEGKVYAERLRAAGNHVQLKEYSGACHDHMIIALEAPALNLHVQCGLDALQDLLVALNTIFHSNHVSTA